MFKIAWKNLSRRKTRTALALVGIALGVGTIISLVGISEAIEGAVTETLGQMQVIQVMEKGAFSPVMSSIPVETLDKIKKIEGIRNVFGVVMRPATEVEGQTSDPMMGGSAYPIVGIDPDENAESRGGGFSGRILKGRGLQNGDGKVVVIGKVIADTFDKNVGLSIEVNKQKFQIIGIFTTGSDLLDNAILMTQEQAYEVTGIEKDTLSTITVEPLDLTEMDRIAKLIEFSIDGVDAKTGTEYAESISSMTGFLSSFFWVISMLSAIIGAVGIINTMLMSVIERTNEFGLMKAVGWSSGNIIRLVMTEAILVGFIGGITGLTVGLIGIYLLNVFVGVTSVLSPILVVQSMTLAITFGTLGGIYPAFRATRIDPIEALREG